MSIEKFFTDQYYKQANLIWLLVPFSLINSPSVSDTDTTFIEAVDKSNFLSLHVPLELDVIVSSIVNVPETFLTLANLYYYQN